MKPVSNKKKRRPVARKKEFQSAAQSSFQADENSQNNLQQINQRIIIQKQQQKRRNESAATPSLHPNTQQETAGQSMSAVTLPRPYQFLKFANPSLHMIFFPHFAIKTLNFGLSILLTILFIILLIYNYSKQQNDFRWNCSLFQLQNKFFPRLRYDYQFWRVIISGFFHSNVAHFCLNIFGLQVYGYFVQWYYGKLKYGLSLITSVIVSHFFSAAVDTESISTLSSSLLFCIIALKIWFLYEYWDYRPLQNRKLLIVALLLLITIINLIPIFVVNNVDFTGHLGGLMVGGLLGGFYHLIKEEENIETDEQRSQYPKKWKVIKWISLVAVPIFGLICLIIVFTTHTQTLEAMNYKIDEKCQ